MRNHLITLFLLFNIFVSLKGQEGSFAGSISTGLAFHGVYTIIDQGDKIGLGPINYYSNMARNVNVLGTIGFSYYFPFARFDANFSLYDEFYFGAAWESQMDVNGYSIRGQLPIIGSFNGILYRNKPLPKSRFSLNPGFGLGLYKLDLLNHNDPLRATSGQSDSDTYSITFRDEYLNKLTYQVIGALDGSFRIINNVELFANLKYQFGPWKMYLRTYDYFKGIDFMSSKRAAVQYNGTNCNFNLGVRIIFGKPFEYNLIE